MNSKELVDTINMLKYPGLSAPSVIKAPKLRYRQGQYGQDRAGHSH